MSNLRFFVMVALCGAAGVWTAYSPPVAVFHALFVVVMGFDAIVRGR